MLIEPHCHRYHFDLCHGMSEGTEQMQERETSQDQSGNTLLA